MTSSIQLSGAIFFLDEAAVRLSPSFFALLDNACEVAVGSSPLSTIIKIYRLTLTRTEGTTLKAAITSDVSNRWHRITLSLTDERSAVLLYPHFTPGVKCLAVDDSLIVFLESVIPYWLATAPMSTLIRRCVHQNTISADADAFKSCSLILVALTLTSANVTPRHQRGTYWLQANTTKQKRLLSMRLCGTFSPKGRWCSNEAEMWPFTRSDYVSQPSLGKRTASRKNTDEKQICLYNGTRS